MIYRRLSDPDEFGFVDVIEYDSDGTAQALTLHNQFFAVLNLYRMTDGRHGATKSKLHRSLFYAPYPRAIHKALRLQPKWHATKVPLSTMLVDDDGGER